MSMNNAISLPRTTNRHTDISTSAADILNAHIKHHHAVTSTCMNKTLRGTMFAFADFLAYLSLSNRCKV